MNSTADGQGAMATAMNATAVGQGAVASNIGGSAYGQGSVASGLGSTASGQLAMATATASSAYGIASAATALGATAVGAGSVAPTVQSTAVGFNSAVTATNSVALGSYSSAGVANAGSAGFNVNPVSTQRIGVYASATSVVSVGGGVGSPVPFRQITNVADGAIAPNSTDAINGSQLYQTITGLSTAILQVRRESREGIAGAVSLTTAPMPSQGGKTTYAANVGFFKDAAAVGGSFAHRLDTNAPVAFTGGIAVSGAGVLTGRVGMIGEF